MVCALKLGKTKEKRKKKKKKKKKASLLFVNKHDTLIKIATLARLHDVMRPPKHVGTFATKARWYSH